MRLRARRGDPGGAMRSPFGTQDDPRPTIRGTPPITLQRGHSGGRQTAVRTDFVNVGGTRLRVMSGGRGPAVVLLHGLGASLEWWEEVARLLAGDYSVLVPDLPGHGLSDEPDGGYALEIGRGAVAGLLDARDLPVAAIVGNSMGGLVALDFAFHRPERVSALVLAASAGFSRSLGWGLRLAILDGVGSVALRLVRHEWSARVAFGQLFFDPRRIPASWLARVVRLARRHSYRRSFLGCLRYGVDTGGLRREIVARVRARSAALGAPALLLWGDHDKVIPPIQARIALRIMPNARLEILARCGHVPQLELPEETYARINTFLRDALPR
jgi:pimeloyl-ACP methyl ester carboxylesterase